MTLLVNEHKHDARLNRRQPRSRGPFSLWRRKTQFAPRTELWLVNFNFSRVHRMPGDLALIFCIYGKMLRKWAVVCLETKKYERQNRISFRTEIVGFLWFFNVNSFWTWILQIYRCVCLGRLFSVGHNEVSNVTNSWELLNMEESIQRADRRGNSKFSSCFMFKEKSA